MMVILVLLAVGLLSLSSISLRGTTAGKAAAEARSNARLALLLAVGELQRELGPDRRINCQSGIDGLALSGQGNWLGVYDAWNSDQSERPELDNQFRGYLVSGEGMHERDAAAKQLTGESIELVSSGTLGTPEPHKQVVAGLIPMTNDDGEKVGQYAWWVGDENSKAKITAGQRVPEEVGPELLAQHAAQSAPGTGFQLVDSLAGVNGTGRADWDLGDNLRSKVVSFGSADLLSGGNGNVGSNFHDITTESFGVLTDVRVGGLKRDLSLYLGREFDRRLRQPLYDVQSGSTVNFSPDSEDASLWDTLDEHSGITMEELWLYYNLYREVAYSRPSSEDMKVGVLPAAYPTLLSPNSRDDVIRDRFYIYKRKIFSQVKYILSLATVPSSVEQGKYDLRISVDPVVVLWNPNNVALEYQVGGYSTVGFSSLPYECVFEVSSSAGSKTTAVPFSNFFSTVNGVAAQVGKAHRIVLGPGESRVFSPAADKTGGKSITVDLESGWDFTTGALFSDSTFPTGLSSQDRVKVTLKPVASTRQDYITYWFGPRSPDPALQAGTISLWQDMVIGKTLPEIITPQAYSVSTITNEEKVPLMLFSYYLRPENDTETASRPWIWNNPAIVYRWPADGSISSRVHRQFEMKVVGIDTWENPYVQVTPDNQAYWGGGVRADFGVPFFTHRSIPLTPPLSLAALQHSCANGFRRYWKDSPISTGGPGTFPQDAESLDGYQYLAPKVSKAIGNSFAHPLIAEDRTDGELFAHLGDKNSSAARNHTIADHAYLANAALWDSWYFSSLAPQTVEAYGDNRRDLQQVFDDFFTDTAEKQPVPLPSARMRPYRTMNQDPQELIRNSIASDDAYRQVAGHLMVDGAFNVNSTSVTAWKAILGSLRGHNAVRRDRGDRSVRLESGSYAETVVNGLIIANGPYSKPSGDPQEPNQWTGFRTLDDREIGELAESLVEEIKLRGPFLCLSDFINRRPGRNTAFARQGTLQAAIERSGINQELEEGTRTTGPLASVPFPDAGKGSKAAGMPGYIGQADLLTPLGPTLQARSDTFTIRAYGSATDNNGAVIARAWCEAIVQRVPDYIEGTDAPGTSQSLLSSAANRVFGRKLDLVGFRWLTSDEI
ncbi:hypothetical protein [Haloferula rosea]|uniref:Uncharacterized protein n=1 Tax=Haloferula rosea TaxID=490093 RepID=A0A934RAI5_9BACT|nr:hypothetical protein [Haloferula rosea]MBK1825804.1 hypothetical protein [Haloferula rosea]